jgi:tRNA threonylcarbamoyladenosine biosynthesis protein TsaE
VAKPLQLVTPSARATFLLGRRLGARLGPGHCVGLVGDLGAGKTVLSRGACEGAGVAAGDVSSPTFAIVQTYRGRLPVHHADLYRLGDADELYATGLPDLLGGEGAVLAEWADRIAGWLPPEHLVIRLEEVPRHLGWRRATFLPAGEAHRALAEAVAGGGSGKRAGSRSGKGPGPGPGQGPGSGSGRGAVARQGRRRAR